LTDHHCLHTLYSNKWTWATDDVSLFRAAAFINTRSSTSDASYNNTTSSIWLIFTHEWVSSFLMAHQHN